jgi:glyoxylase-like metal-dependent hydrolase (beta-lactamase superfamily II)
MCSCALRREGGEAVVRKALVLVLASSLLACGRDANRAPAAVSADARRVLEAAARRLGSVEAPGRAVGFVAEGTLDKAQEGQGFQPGQSSPGPFGERLAVDPSSGRVARHYHEERFDGSFEMVGEVYGPDDGTLVVLPTYGVVVRSTDAQAQETAQRIARRIPHVLVRELLEDAQRVERAWGERDAVVVAGRLRDGHAVTVRLDRSDSTVSSVALVDELAGRGPTTVVWSFADYRTVGSGVALPWRYDVDLDGAPYLRMHVTAPLDGVELEAAFAVPDSLRVIDVESAGAAGAEPAPLELVQLADGVFQVPEVRGGFAPLVMAFEGFSVVVDAPASFPLLAELPPGHTDPAPSMSHHSERLIDAVAAALPDQPIRYVVLTHGHLDHVGGVRAFVHAGATVLGAPSVRASVERLVERDDVRPDRLAGNPRPLQWEDVTGARDITDGQRTLRLLPLGHNPHDAGTIVVHVVGADLLFVSDLFTPTRLEDYPRAHHVALDRFLDSWLLAQALEPDRIVSMHGSGEITAAHRAKLR